MNLTYEYVINAFLSLGREYSSVLRIVDASEIDTLLGVASVSRLMPDVTSSLVSEEICRISVEDEVNKLLEKLRQLYDQLEAFGMTRDDVRQALWQEMPISRLEVKENLSLCFPDYDGKTIRLPRMQYVIYRLFLNHPEGIFLKQLPDFTDELRCIYRQSFSHTGGSFNQSTMEAKLCNVTDPSKHTMIEYISHIRQIIATALDSDTLAQHYCIRGTRNHCYKITISRDFVITEASEKLINKKIQPLNSNI